MEQKYYIANTGSPYLSLTNHPGVLMESDIVNNFVRMMESGEEEQPNTKIDKQIRIEANRFYQENIERILKMVELHAKLVEITAEEAEEYMNLTFEEWMLWEFPQTEWD
mgnify:CR=1 FL=1